MLLFDHEKLGIEKMNMLSSLKEWFFSVRSDSAFDDGEMDDDEIGSYILPVAELGTKTVEAAHKVQASIAGAEAKLAKVMAGMKDIVTGLTDKMSAKFEVGEDRTGEFQSEIEQLQRELKVIEMQVRQPPSVRLSVCLSACLPACLPARLTVSTSVCLVCLFFCLFTCLPACVCFLPSFYFPIFSILLSL